MLFLSARAAGSVQRYGVVPGSPQGATDTNECSRRLYARVAAAVIEQLDAVRAEPAIETDERRLGLYYDWATRFPGSGFEEFCGPEFVETVLEAKRRKGLL